MKWKRTKDPEVIAEIMTEDYISAQSVKNAVWQYLIDHARVVNDDRSFKVSFYVVDEHEFWRRVKARELGKFKRNDLLEFFKEAEKKFIKFKDIRAKVEKIEANERQNNWWNKTLVEAEKNGNWRVKLLFKLSRFLRKVSNRLRKKALKQKPPEGGSVADSKEN